MPQTDVTFSGLNVECFSLSECHHQEANLVSLLLATFWPKSLFTFSFQHYVHTSSHEGWWWTGGSSVNIVVRLAIKRVVVV